MAGSMESAKQKTWFAPAGSNPKGTGSFAFGIMKCSATRVACSSHSLRRWRTPTPTLPQGGGRKSEALAAKGEDKGEVLPPPWGRVGVGVVDNPAMPQADRWDIFCRVVDNYGDVGVSWRL